MNPRLFFFLSLSRSLYPCLLCNDTRNGQWSHEMSAWFDVYIYIVFFDIAELNWRRYLGGFHWLVESVCILFVYFYKRRVILVWRKRLCRIIRIVLYAIQINRNSFEVQVYRLLEIWIPNFFSKISHRSS